MTAPEPNVPLSRLRPLLDVWVSGQGTTSAITTLAHRSGLSHLRSKEIVLDRVSEVSFVEADAVICAVGEGLAGWLRYLPDLYGRADDGDQLAPRRHHAAEPHPEPVAAARGPMGLGHGDAAARDVRVEALQPGGLAFDQPIERSGAVDALVLDLER